MENSSLLYYRDDTTARMGLYLFAVPWIIVGLQHYIYADFVSTLVPAFMPGKAFWVYFTGTAMIAAGISFLTNINVKLAAMLLAIMLAVFILLIHIPKLAGDPQTINYTRAWQDTAITGAALMLTNNLTLMKTGRILYALFIGVLGAQHFSHVPFITAKVPTYFPFIMQLDYLIGIVMIVAAIGLLFKQYHKLGALLLGVLTGLFALLNGVPVLVGNIHNGQQWTAFMLEIALCAGAFISLRISFSNQPGRASVT